MLWAKERSSIDQLAQPVKSFRLFSYSPLVDQLHVWWAMRKLQDRLFFVRTLFFFGASSLLSIGCSTSPQEEVVKTSYYHTYGPQVDQADWADLGGTGEVVEVLKNGVEVRKEYVGGVLQGTSSWTFPYTKVTDRVEEYHDGQRIITSCNYETGSPKFQEELLPKDQRIVHAWYDDGSPRLIEEYKGTRLAEAQYFTIDGEVEGSVLGGNGMKVERSRNGELLTREQLKGSEVVASESFYSNGQLREAIAYQDLKRHGQSRRFSEDGEPLSVEQWTCGVVDGTQLFFEGGQPVRQITYAMGKKEGAELRFRPGTEEVVEEISWHQDVRHGPSKTYLGDQILTEWYWRGNHTSEEQFVARNSIHIALNTPKSAS